MKSSAALASSPADRNIGMPEMRASARKTGALLVSIGSRAGRLLAFYLKYLRFARRGRESASSRRPAMHRAASARRGGPAAAATALQLNARASASTRTYRGRFMRHCRLRASSTSPSSPTTFFSSWALPALRIVRPPFSCPREKERRGEKKREEERGGEKRAEAIVAYLNPAGGGRVCVL